MKKIPFHKSEYLLSVTSEKEIPSIKNSRGTLLPEIALVGRSNVGKSSFLNFLFQKKDLAKISSTPGKTQALNFFLIDQFFLFVDLPGYGYAKVSQEMKKKWAPLIEAYFFRRHQLKLLLLFLDLRRIPTEEDKRLVSFAHFHKIPLLFILTKKDKLAPHEQKKAHKQIFDSFSAVEERASLGKEEMIAMSIFSPEDRERILKKMELFLKVDP